MFPRSLTLPSCLLSSSLSPATFHPPPLALVACQDEFRSNFRCRRRRRRFFFARGEMLSLGSVNGFCSCAPHNNVDSFTRILAHLFCNEKIQDKHFISEYRLIFCCARSLAFHQLFDRRSLESEPNRGENERKAVGAEILAPFLLQRFDCAANVSIQSTNSSVYAGIKSSHAACVRPSLTFELIQGVRVLPFGHVHFMI